MQPWLLLHKILENSGAIKHKTRLMSLMHAVNGVLSGAKLSLTSIGRHMEKKIKPRSKIQEMNYLLGNGQLNNEKFAVYRTMTKLLCASRTVLYIAIDWSTVVPHELHLLRASLICKGRSMVLYEEIHPEKKLSNGLVHMKFLERLKSMLPANVPVCTITDAGFQTDFFKQVISIGWNFTGRLLTNMHYTLEGKNEWQPCASLYPQANEKARFIGAVELSKATRTKANLHLLKKMPKPKSRGKKRKVYYARKEKEHRNAAQKPWLIATSLKNLSIEIMKIYRVRMKIEHDFRDVKDPQWGIGLRASRCKDLVRLSLLLLIGSLAIFLLWVIGLTIENEKLQYDFQANSYKHKRVLSLVFLGLEAIRSGYLQQITLPDITALQNSVDYLDESLPVQILC
jgi:hypothetical protein